MMPIPPLSIDKICEYLDIGRDDFYKWIMMKELPAYYLALSKNRRMTARALSGIKHPVRQSRTAGDCKYVSRIPPGMGNGPGYRYRIWNCQKGFEKKLMEF